MGRELNPIIGFESYTAEATFTATTAQAGYGATNLGVLPLNYVWRSNAYTLGNIADQDLKWTFGGEDRAVRTISAVRHNFSLDATVRVRLYSDAAWTTLIYDSDADTDLIGGAEVWPPVYGDAELEWEDDNWFTGKQTARQIEGQTWMRVIDLRVFKLHKSGKLTISDAGNAALYLQCGYLDLSRSHQFTRGPSFGASRGGQSNEVKNRANGGVLYVSDGVYKRSWRCNLQYLPRTEAQNIAGRMKRQYQGKTPMIWHPFPGDPKMWFHNSMFCTFDQLDLGQIAQANLDSEPLSLIEV